MSKLISVNENGVIYVESDSGDVFGIVSATEITDGDGIRYERDALTVLEDNGFELTQFWELEETAVDLENGVSVCFSGDSVIVESN